MKVDGVDVALDTLLNQAPTVAAVITAEVAEDGVLSGKIAATDADGDTLTYAMTGAPANGQLTIDAATGAYTYTPAANWSGADSFAVKVTDSFGNVSSQTVNLAVTAVADAPTVAATATATGAEDGVLTGQIVATDVDGDTLTYAVAGAPANGQLTIDAATGAYSYTPAANWFGDDSFAVAVTDSTGKISTQIVNLAVTPVADAPTVAASATAEAAEDGVLTGQIVATDVDGDALSYAVSGAPANGVLAIDAATGAYTYTPAANWSGADSFAVEVTDSTGNVSTQTVNLVVTATADAPTVAVMSPVVTAAAVTVIGNGAANTLKGGAGSDVIDGGNGDDVLSGNGASVITVQLDIQSGLTDLDGSETLNITVGNVPAGGLLSAGHDNGDGTWTLTGNQLTGLTLTASVTAGFTLTVASTATEANGSTAAASATIDVSLGADSNRIVGGAGNDVVTGGSGNDLIYGGGTSVAPTSTGTSGKAPKPSASDNDTIDAGDGNDIVHGGRGNDTIAGGTGNDTLNGNSGNDTISDGTGNDLVDGSSGNDLVLAGAGDDVYKGGSGFDTLDFSGATGSMSIDVSTGKASGAGIDTFSTFEMIVGSDYADTFKGSSKADKLDGGAGDDNLRGLGGADVLTGGDGSDTFQWLAKDVLSGKKHLGVDKITDFGQGDHLDLHDMLEKFSGAQLANAVHVTDGKAGSMVSVNIGGSFVDVVELQGVHGLTAADMLGSGMILA